MDSTSGLAGTVPALQCLFLSAGVLLAGLIMTTMLRNLKRIIGGCIWFVVVFFSGGICYVTTTVLFGMASGLVTSVIVMIAVGLVTRQVLHWLNSLRPR